MLRYETFTAGDYQRFLQQYCVNREATSFWAIPDLSKPGLRPQHAAHRIVAPQLQRITHYAMEDAELVLAELTLPDDLWRTAGAPRRLGLAGFPHAAPIIEVTLRWLEKPANRMPEALWCTFAPRVAEPEGWCIDKLGVWLSPLQVARDSNRHLHAVGAGVRYAGADGTLYSPRWMPRWLPRRAALAAIR